MNLEQLTAEIIRLVPEVASVRCPECDYSGLWSYDQPRKINLEICRVALRKSFEENYKGKFRPLRITKLGRLWQDLQPWESQTEVHLFLEKYLL